MNETEFEHADDRATLAALARTLPPVAPPDDLFDRVLGEISGEATVVPLRPRRWRVALGGLAVVAAAAALVLAVVTTTESGGPAARTTLEAKDGSSVTGEAELFDPDLAGGRVTIALRDVPPAPSGHHYEVWVLREGTNEMEAVGAFTPTSEKVNLDLQLPGPGDFVAVDISVEENGGPPEHSGTSLAGGSFA
jgi:anti-sigma-K factor RskA